MPWVVSPQIGARADFLHVTESPLFEILEALNVLSTGSPLYSKHKWTFWDLHMKDTEIFMLNKSRILLLVPH